MKILFYNGNLNDLLQNAFIKGANKAFERTLESFGTNTYYSVDAGDGVTLNGVELSLLLEKTSDGSLPKDLPIFTNSIIALDNIYCWNEETDSCDLYVFVQGDGRFVPVQDLLGQKIKNEDNIQNALCLSKYVVKPMNERGRRMHLYEYIKGRN